MAKRQVFFSFEYNKDAWRASQVRNMGKVDNSSTFSDNDWEEVKEKTDHINDLISYRYGPSFREDKFTEKPNKTSFNFIVTNTIENLHQNYIHKVYN